MELLRPPPASSPLPMVSWRPRVPCRRRTLRSRGFLFEENPVVFVLVWPATPPLVGCAVLEANAAVAAASE